MYQLQGYKLAPYGIKILTSVVCERLKQVAKALADRTYFEWLQI